ncbi:MAG: UDP-N-acetylmuramate--L-alanine ligase [Leptotrichiaceae bacterium]|jgi:UDP-N-acetylmuramate--alanine ligase|nr:UDP-N-acetylmuramate--L-alanine ligase [Leptotrichiaceae bacterium]MBP7026814.1 UDP-N-acetylmuramate--L-alanine ligase [Leptotrichiaceae bacterium]MBP8637528.1 UDP-N-acetylmuramate--L-alanine ligase [Leptotrichiaceae bacterium]MBP9538844.1 UDP-N-acetylmuramate--L-alanine ligase [Leptotrichiaceae bacterium]MBP9876296.1 UDP-N-acetylmuramate--L-alanine ligase [Leptotrichiaceae bacterium]
MLKNIKNIYFSGINGIGMSGLAKIMKEQGYSVYGSDLEIKPVTEEMEQMGIEVFIGQKEENLIGKRIDLFVYSTAIKDTNPEYRYIVTNGIKSIKRGQLLAELMNDFEGIAVAGTHGKTTTSSMMSVAFLEKDPYIVVGGIIPEIQSNSRIGHSDIFIAEADESDNSFLFLKPKYSVVTNVEPDHLEHHGTFENIKKSFEEFIDKTEKLAVLCADSEEIRNLNIKNENVVWYSIKDENADIFAKNIRIEDGYSVYEVVKDGINIGEFRLSIPGEHNISNSLTVIYLSLELGCSLEFVKNKIYNFKGANRRYQVIYDKGIKIIDDYAHHPTEIKVTIEAAKKNEGKKVNVIFQPHRYSRTKFFLDDFVEALKLADKLILMPIYSAGEENIYDITSEKLAEMVGKDVLVCEKEEIEEIVKNNKESNEIFIFMGAGSVSKVAHDITNKL